MAKSKAGGGIRSRVVTEKQVRYGEHARAINERGVSQIGQNLGNHVTDRRQVVNPVERVRGQLRPSGGPGGIPLGNETAKCQAGPGGGRTLYGQSGTQGMHGAANPGAPTERRDILSEFGRESPIVGNRK
jgi:hypothetical protein